MVSFRYGGDDSEHVVEETAGRVHFDDYSGGALALGSGNHPRHKGVGARVHSHVKLGDDHRLPRRLRRRHISRHQ